MVNTGYTINSIIIYILYFIAYRNNKVNILFPAYTLVAIRDTFRMCDFEDTASHLTNAEYMIIIYIQYAKNVTIIVGAILTFNKIRGATYYYVVYIIMLGVSLAIGSLKFKNDDNEYLTH